MIFAKSVIPTMPDGSTVSYAPTYYGECTDGPLPSEVKIRLQDDVNRIIVFQSDSPKLAACIARGEFAELTEDEAQKLVDSADASLEGVFLGDKLAHRWDAKVEAVAESQTGVASQALEIIASAGVIDSTGKMIQDLMPMSLDEFKEHYPWAYRIVNPDTGVVTWEQLWTKDSRVVATVTVLVNGPGAAVMTAKPVYVKLSGFCGKCMKSKTVFAQIPPFALQCKGSIKMPLRVKCDKGHEFTVQYDSKLVGG